MKAIKYACFKLEKKILEVLNEIKAILLTLQEINFPRALDEQS